jgi:hypothetical protein
MLISPTLLGSDIKLAGTVQSLITFGVQISELPRRVLFCRYFKNGTSSGKEGGAVRWQTVKLFPLCFSVN